MKLVEGGSKKLKSAHAAGGGGQRSRQAALSWYVDCTLIRLNIHSFHPQTHELAHAGQDKLVSMIRGAVLASFQLHYESSTDLPQMFLLINCDRPDRRATVVWG